MFPSQIAFNEATQRAAQICEEMAESEEQLAQRERARKNLDGALPYEECAAILRQAAARIRGEG